MYGNGSNGFARIHRVLTTSQDDTKDDNERQAAAKSGNSVGDALAKRNVIVEFLISVCCQQFVFTQAFDNFLFEGCQLAAFSFQNALYILATVTV